MAVLDAGRGEVYAGEYDVREDRAHRVREQLLTEEQLMEAARTSIVVSADRQFTETARQAGMTVNEIELPRADVVAQLGWRKISAGEIVSPEALDANYIRSSSDIYSRSSS